MKTVNCRGAHTLETEAVFFYFPFKCIKCFLWYSASHKGMDVYGFSPYFLRVTPFVKESIFLTVFRGQIYQVLLSMFSKIPSATLHIVFILPAKSQLSNPVSWFHLAFIVRSDQSQPWHYFVYKHLIGVSYIVHKHRAGYFCIIWRYDDAHFWSSRFTPRPLWKLIWYISL